MLHDLLLVIVGGGTVAALLKFIEFLIQHRTHKKERIEDRQDDVGNLRKELKQHLVDENSKWKEQYCDRNAQSIDELKEVSSQLKDNVILLTDTITSMKEYNINVGDAVQGIIHDRILHNVDCYIARQGITKEELTTLKSMYRPYKKLGGNGDVETAYEIVTDLDVISKDEAAKRDLEIEKKKFSWKEG